MNGLFLLRLVRNGIWLVLALGCTAIVSNVFHEVQPLNIQENVVLGTVMLASALVIELMPRDGKNNSFFRCSLVFILAASLALAVLSQVPALVTVQTSLVMAALLLFLAFRGIACALACPWRYPPFLSTRVMLLGNGATADNIRKLIENSRGRFTLGETLPLRASAGRGREEDVDRICRKAQKAGIQTIVVSFPERRGVMPVEQILKCRMLGIRVIEAQAFYERVTRRLYIEGLKPSHIIFSSGFCLSGTRRAIKRTVDVVAAALGLLALSPLFPVIALAIRLDSPGPVFFRQVRTGRGDLPFLIFKFRTMRRDAEKDSGAVWAREGDSRVTRVGSFLRKTRLDEIPQLLNVLFGEMSLVGPRPERPEFIGELKKSIPFYGERHCVKPGVTGWAQVRYPYGASVADALEKLRYDLYYIKNQSLRLELEIILRTILVIFTRSGAR